MYTLIVKGKYKFVMNIEQFQSFKSEIFDQNALFELYQKWWL
jgi:hypothetical protein